jgi:hypothetical protein
MNIPPMTIKAITTIMAMIAPITHTTPLLITHPRTIIPLHIMTTPLLKQLMKIHRQIMMKTHHLIKMRPKTAPMIMTTPMRKITSK